MTCEPGLEVKHFLMIDCNEAYEKLIMDQLSPCTFKVFGKLVII
jgi:hypothetical protein